VAVSFESPEYTADVDAMGTLRLLEAIRFLGLEKKTRFIRRGNAAELFSGIRHIAINILTNDKVFKAGLRRKMRK
ncbi:GDP-mannose 4,6-dehydratase, partial [Escherichia coli]|nr:GDP-mannose 4,6-dehydratase [Escherichia coli]